MSSRPSKYEYYMSMLNLVASRSTCVRRSVGAIITDKDGHVLSMGYNGVPRNFDHCTSVPCGGARDNAGDNSSCMAVHAEQNSLLQCNDLSAAHTMYVSCVPCFHCAKMIANTEIKTIFAQKPYADIRGRDVLLEAGIAVFVEGIPLSE